MEKDYFSILELKPTSNEEEVKQAYRNLAKKYHPDINHSPEAHDKFLEISEAYEFLLDHMKVHDGRTVYYDPDDSGTREYFEEMRRKAKERAQEKARIRVEKLKKEQEDFQESGLYDLVLLASYIIRYSLLLFCVFLLAWPIIISLDYVEIPFIVRLIVFIVGGIGIYFISIAGKKFFVPGSFYYNFKQIKNVFNFKNIEAQECCFYNSQYKANSHPYKINLFKIKDIKLHNYGPGQHGVAFDQKNITLKIPRSHYAFVVHFVLIAIRIFILFACIFFLNINSFLWRIIIAIFLSWIVSSIVSMVTKTRTSNSFLLTAGLIIRMCIWLTVVYIVSFIQFKPFNIYTSDAIQAITVIIVLFDSFLDQFLNFISGRKFQKPLMKQHPLITLHLEKKYQFGYDMPVLSVFYPFYKWFFG